MSAGVPRTGLQVAWAAWHALLLREAVTRMFSRRAALAWLLLEPAAHVGVLALLFVALRVRHVGGMDAALWSVAGMLAFFLFRRTAQRGAAALDANRALLAYRQVKPVDTVLARCVLEGLVMLLVAGLTLAAAALAGVRLAASDPAGIALAAAGLWLLATGWALVASVLVALVAEAGQVLAMGSTGLMLASGVMLPLASLPPPWRGWLMLNPVAQGVEAVRAGISPFYHHAPELDLAYLYLVALALAVLGLALQLRFARRVVAR